MRAMGTVVMMEGIMTPENQRMMGANGRKTMKDVVKALDSVSKGHPDLPEEEMTLHRMGMMKIPTMMTMPMTSIRMQSRRPEGGRGTRRKRRRAKRRRIRNGRRRARALHPARPLRHPIAPQEVLEISLTVS